MKTTTASLAAALAFSLMVSACGQAPTDRVTNDDASANTDTVTILLNTWDGTPVSGQTVLFHDDIGAYLQSVDSDAAGAASLELAGGGSVTILPMIDEFDLFTLAGLRPGIVDITVLEDFDAFLDPDSGGANEQDPAVVLIDPPASPAGAEELVVSAGCDTFLTPSPVPGLAEMVVWPQCVVDGMVDILATAIDDQHAPLAYSLLRDVTPSTNTAAEFEGWRYDFSEVPVQLVGAAPALVGFAEAQPILRGTRLGAAGFNRIPADGSELAGVAMLIPDAESALVQAELNYGKSYESTPPAYALAQRRVDDPSQPVVFAFDHPSLSPANGFTDEFEAGRRVVRTSAAAVETADWMNLVAVGSSADDPAIFKSWRVIAPAAAEYRFPELPEELASFAALTEIGVFELSDFETLNGYQDFLGSGPVDTVGLSKPEDQLVNDGDELRILWLFEQE